MPSHLPLPTIRQLVKAFHDGVRGGLDKREDGRSGSAYDIWAGLGAVLFRRQAQRDRDLFRAVYDGTADGVDLTQRLQTRYGVARNLDAFGVGTAQFARPTASGGAGTIWAGTRVRIVGLTGQTTPIEYKVAGDTPVAATTLTTPVPISATVRGVGAAIDTSQYPGARLIVPDSLFDATWTATALQCFDGTAFELAPDYRARVKAFRFASRVGYKKRIVDTCMAAGAAHVAAFASNFGGQPVDTGLSVVYVGDPSYTGTTALIRACASALESIRVAGADLQVLPMASGVLAPAATVYLWDDPGKFNTDDLFAGMTAALTNYFAPEQAGFAYRLSAMSAAMTKPTSAVQSIVWANPVVDLNVLGAGNQFPATLTKWACPASGVTLSFQPPQ